MSSEDSITETFAELRARAELKPPAALREAVCAQCTRDLKPKRGLSRGARLLLSALLGSGAVLLMWLVGERGPGTGSAALLGAAAWSGALGAVLLVGLGSTATCKFSCGARWGILLALPILSCGALLFLSTHWMPFGDFVEGDQVLRSLPCGSIALLTGSIVSGGILMLWRRTDPFSPGLSGALVGLLGALAGSLGVGFACPSAEGWHMGVGHALTVTALVSVGWLAGKRLLAP